MKAGKELDALVAEGIFLEPKPTAEPVEIARISLQIFYRTGTSKAWQPGWDNDNKQPIWIPLPFSTDISAAWKVVEKLQPTLCLSLQIHKDCVDACFSPHDEIFRSDGSHMHKGESASAPHAICLAALKTVEATP